MVMISVGVMSRTTIAALSAGICPTAHGGVFCAVMIGSFATGWAALRRRVFPGLVAQ
jgi:hypothetical protein